MATTRERIIDSTAELFRRQGYTGTGLKQIVEEASAPFGSVYHHFPGGKVQLGEEVVRSSGRMYMQLFVAVVAEYPDVPTAVEQFFLGAAKTLRETGYADACPIETVALEVASTNEPLRKATADVFDLWFDGATAYLVNAGIPRDRARELAIHMLCALEGAFVFCRAMRSTESLEVAGAAVAAQVREALAAVPG